MRGSGGWVLAEKGETFATPTWCQSLNLRENICKITAKNEPTESTSQQKSVQIYDFRPFVVQILVHQVLGNGDLVMQVIFAL